MIHHRRLYAVVGAASLLAVAACNDLDVTNPNNPDIERALATPDDVRALAVSTLNTWYLTATYIEHPHMMSVTADVTTSNFGNFGMRFNNLEPRIPYANSTTNNDRFVTEDAWDGFYGAIGAANDALRAMNAGVLAAAERDKYAPLAMFAQAASYTNIAWMFDKAFVVTEDTDPDNPPDLVPYSEVADTAAAMWQRLIDATTGKSHVYATTDLPMPDGVLTSQRLNRIAHTFYAMLLAYMPRNPSQSASVNWSQVALLADKGMGTGSAGAPFDFEVEGDGQTWWSYIAAYGEEQSWIRMDHRVMNRMAPHVPPKFDGTIPPQGTSPDARYTTDFSYVSPPIGDPARGIYMQSVFAHTRHAHHAAGSPTAFETPVPYILAAESDLVRAEALIRSGGSLATAADLINITRVGRGGLSAATAAEGVDGLLSRISYERDVELTNTSGTTLFWRRAVTDQPIQAGTPCQLPIPEKELQTLGLPTYTFGGNLPCS